MEEKLKQARELEENSRQTKCQRRKSQKAALLPLLYFKLLLLHWFVGTSKSQPLPLKKNVEATETFSSRMSKEYDGGKSGDLVTHFAF